jgi:flavin reductase (DIM6/NTAB) family NADH-FMN oxidoreductase RutF
MHKISDPSILYFGTPVVLVGTTNVDMTFNLAPISSVFWLGWRAMIGISAFSKTTENLLRTGECTLNLPSVNEVDAVNRLALTTGSDPVPEGKRQKGYRFEGDKFGLSGLVPRPAGLVQAPLAAECPVQLEAVLMGMHPLADESPAQRGRLLSLELKIVRVHLDEAILMDGQPNRVDPDKWRPLIMSFQQFYGLGQQVHPSTLAQVPERLYRTPDIEAAMTSVMPTGTH